MFCGRTPDPLNHTGWGQGGLFSTCAWVVPKSVTVALSGVRSEQETSHRREGTSKAFISATGPSARSPQQGPRPLTNVISPHKPPERDRVLIIPQERAVRIRLHWVWIVVTFVGFLFSGSGLVTRVLWTRPRLPIPILTPAAAPLGIPACRAPFLGSHIRGCFAFFLNSEEAEEV